MDKDLEYPVNSHLFFPCGIGFRKNIREDCYYYECEHEMGANIDCCGLKPTFGDCPCSADCENYISRKEASKAVTAYVQSKHKENPRLLDIEEFADAEEGTVVWVEHHTEERDYLSAMVCSGEGTIGNFYLGICLEDLQSKNVRYWSSRPTDEQREKVKWND